MFLLWLVDCWIACIACIPHSQPSTVATLRRVEIAFWNKKVKYPDKSDIDCVRTYRKEIGFLRLVDKGMSFKLLMKKHDTFGTAGDGGECGREERYYSYQTARFCGTY